MTKIVSCSGVLYRAVFNEDKVHMFTMNKSLSKHLTAAPEDTPVPGEEGASVQNGAAKAEDAGAESTAAATAEAGDSAPSSSSSSSAAPAEEPKVDIAGVLFSMCDRSVLHFFFLICADGRTPVGEDVHVPFQHQMVPNHGAQDFHKQTKMFYCRYPLGVAALRL